MNFIGSELAIQVESGPGILEWIIHGRIQEKIQALRQVIKEHLLLKSAMIIDGNMRSTVIQTLNGMDYVKNRYVRYKLY